MSLLTSLIKFSANKEIELKLKSQFRKKNQSFVGNSEIPIKIGQSKIHRTNFCLTVKI